MCPNWLWLFLIFLPLLAYDIFYKKKKIPRVGFSHFKILKKLRPYGSIYRYIFILLRFLALTFIILALARPRLANKKEKITGKGIDIFIVVDVSGSMRAVDFKPKNRLNAAKKVATQFIEKRKNDRIGLVTFAENAFTQAPLTLDYNILTSIMKQIEIDEEGNGTAIGMGLAMGVARLKDSDADSKVMILLTDGENNTGEINPREAAELASAYDIKVYPVGIGKKGLVDFPVKNAFGATRYRKVKINVDMELLNEIAEMTEVDRARKARNTEELQEIFNQIDKMERTEYNIEHYYTYKEYFHIFLYLAFILLVIELLFKFLFRKVIP